jgi:hypothetical protein
VSQYQQKDNSGSLFKVEEKQSERHPDMSGSAMIDGVEYFFDAWFKVADSGRRWMSCSFKPKQKQAAKPAVKQASQPQRRRDTPEDDSDLPF